MLGAALDGRFAGFDLAGSMARLRGAPGTLSTEAGTLTVGIRGGLNGGIDGGRLGMKTPSGGRIASPN